MKSALTRMARVLPAVLVVSAVLVPSAGAVGDGTRDTTHRMVGVLAVGDDSGARQFACSGFLIAPRTFLTAGHCILDLAGAPASRVWVTFADQVIPDWSTFPPLVTTADPDAWTAAASYATHPGYRENAIKAYNDVGVVRLIDPPRVGTLAVADEVGYLDRLSLTGRWFAFVGYGTNENLDRYWFLGPPHVLWDGYRMRGEAPFQTLTPYYLKLQTNPAVVADASHPGAGDSGAPVLATVGGREVAVAVEMGGNPSLMEAQRLDTPAVQSWLKGQ